MPVRKKVVRKTTKHRSAHLVKGSLEAKQFMARLRAMRRH
jgi:hypothetical protein